MHLWQLQPASVTSSIAFESAALAQDALPSIVLIARLPANSGNANRQSFRSLKWLRAGDVVETDGEFFNNQATMVCDTDAGGQARATYAIST